jgi:hypothetical protein
VLCRRPSRDHPHDHKWAASTVTGKGTRYDATSKRLWTWCNPRRSPHSKLYTLQIVLWSATLQPYIWCIRRCCVYVACFGICVITYGYTMGGLVMGSLGADLLGSVCGLHTPVTHVTSHTELHPRPRINVPCVMCTWSESPSGAPSNTRRDEHAPAANEQTTQNGHRLSSGTTTPLHHNTVSPFARDPRRPITHCGPLYNPSHCIQPSGTITMLTHMSQSARMWSCCQKCVSRALVRI